MLCLMYDFISPPTRKIYLIIMSNNIDCSWRFFLYQVLSSEQVDYILANQSCLSKLYFKLRAIQESSKENCDGHL